MENNNYPSVMDVKKRAIAAIVNLYRHDRELLEINASERSITHRLAMYLQSEFAEWHVDCEYNRRGLDVKRISLAYDSLRPDDLEAKTVFPDIVIHRRLTDKNLIVIEVKKKEHSNNIRHDEEKLRFFITSREYKYEYGLFLVLAPDGKSSLTLLNNSDTEDWTGELQNKLKELEYYGE